MSALEAELVALADCAIELITIMGVLEFVGYVLDGPVEVETDNKGAYDLCHRCSNGKNSRHVERKVFKMRELSHAGHVKVIHVPTEDNWADIFTKPLDNATFTKHRDTILNIAAVPK